MAAIIGQINLLKFKNARRVNASGEKGVFIPLADNPTIFDGGKGCYANVRIVAKESTFQDKHYTHFIALDCPKDIREKMGEEELRSVTPILGNLREWKAEPTYTEEKVEELDDLPFDK